MVDRGHGTDIKGLRSYLLGTKRAKGGKTGLATLAGPAGVFESAVVSEHALLVGQETGYVLPCQR